MSDSIRRRIVARRAAMVAAAATLSCGRDPTPAAPDAAVAVTPPPSPTPTPIPIGPDVESFLDASTFDASAIDAGIVDASRSVPRICLTILKKDHPPIGPIKK